MAGLSWQLARRFRQGTTENGFISFISASSTLGIALGCFVLIVMLSVMNGFERELKNRVLSLIPHGELQAVSHQGIANPDEVLARFSADPRIQSVQPFVKATAMAQKGANMKAVELRGINGLQYPPAFVDSMKQAQWQSFMQNPHGLLLGEGVADKLGLKPGQQVQVLLPKLSDDFSIKAPESVWLTLEGVVSIGGEMDNHLAYMQMAYAAELMNIDSGVQGLAFRFADPFSAPAVMRELGYAFDQHVYISDWTRTQGHLYQDIQLVRMVVYIALTLVIAVACFNIVSTLVMAVNEKQGEIAMLKTMGASDGLIVRTFFWQGLLNGFTGTLLGAFSGVLVASYLSDIARQLEQWLGVAFLSGDIYFIDFLPSQLDWHEVLFTVTIALVLSMLATLYPAMQAAKVKPAEVLGH